MISSMLSRTSKYGKRVVSLNESTINEISTELAGNAYRKAISLGRRSQAKTFADEWMSDLADLAKESDTIVDVNERYISYIPLNKKFNIVRINRGGRVQFGDIFSKEAEIADFANDNVKYSLGASTKFDARIIAKWCDRCLERNEYTKKVIDIVTDWHNWCRL